MDALRLDSSLFTYAAIGMFGLLILESVLAGNWNRFYFTFGLPIFIKRVPVNLFSFPPLDFAKLEAEFSASWVSKSLIFREFEPDLYAFREKLIEMRWSRSSSEVMHGLLFLDQNQQQVVIKGYANWWFLGLTLLFAAVSLTVGNNGLLFAGFYVVVMGFVYFMQARRFSKVAQAVAAQVMAVKEGKG